MMPAIHKKVRSVVFGMLGPEFIRKMSTTKIVTPELYDKEGYPVDGGLMDTHLGIIDPGIRCKTCAGKLKECMGHFGYIELARPVIHIRYVRIILDILRSTCRACGKIILSDPEIAKYREVLDSVEREGGLDARRKKVKEIKNALKNLKKCQHCSEKQYVVKLEKPTTYFERDKRLSPLEVMERLSKVPNDHLSLLGFNSSYARPEWA